MRRLLAIVVLALLFVGGTTLPGCVTPSIPLPPPELSALSFDAPVNGELALSGKPSATHENARFYAFNNSRGAGAIAQAAADGSFATEPFAGSAGDTVEIWYESAGKRSDSFTCTVRLGAPLDTTVCH